MTSSTMTSSTVPKRPTFSELVRQPRYDPETTAVKAKRQRRFRRSIGVAVPVLLIALWQTASVSDWIDSRLYPAPSEAMRAWWKLWAEAALIDDIVASIRVIALGYVLGITAGLGVGIATGLSRFIRSALEPMLNALYVVPKLAFLPVFLTIFGFADKPKIALVTVTVFFFVWIATMEAVARVDRGYVEAARAFGAGKLSTFRHVYVPGMLPEVFVSLRISMGVAVLVTIAAEFIVGGKGLGFLIFNNNQLFLLDRVYAGILTVTIVGVLLMWLVASVGTLLTPWQRVAASDRNE